MLVVIFLTTICSSAIAGDVINYTGNETAEEITAADADGTYHITTAGNLKWLQDVCSSSSTYTKASGKTYKLMSDVVIADGVNWKPIGTTNHASGTINFPGTFDGNGKTVSGLACSGSAYYYTGFFGRVTGTVKNLTVKGKEISSTWGSGGSTSTSGEIGGIAGELNGGSIINCCAQIDLLKCGTLKANGTTPINSNGIGGIVGYVGYIKSTPTTNTIEGCISNCGDIEPANGNAGTNCGGIIGAISGQATTKASVISCISNCKTINATSSSVGSGNNRRGGIIGGCGRGIASAGGTVTVKQCWYVSYSTLGGINTAIGSVNLSSVSPKYPLIDDDASLWGSVATTDALSDKVAALNAALDANAEYKFTLDGFGLCPKGTTDYYSAHVTDAGYATFSSSQALDFSGVTAVTAYTATSIDNGILTMTKFSSKAPASTGLLLKGVKGTDITTIIPVVASADALTTTNYLKATLAATDVAASDATNNIYHYFLMNGNGDGITTLGFYNIDTPRTSGAGMAYLETTTALDKTNGASPINMIFNDGNVTTGINAVNSVQHANNKIYTLSGQEVAAPTKGLYIMNGKKVVIK